MKKLTILSLLIVFAIGLFAQQANNIQEAKFMKYQVNKEYQDNETVIPYKNKSVKATKAIYDTIYYEDFNGGIPAGWTTEDLEGNNQVWQWTDIGAQGPTTTGYEHVLSSSTGFNGWMILDSDLYGSISYDPYDATLTSPAYDFSGYTSVMVVFQELYKRWGNEGANPFGGNPTFVGVSTDGVIWTDIEIHAAFEVKDETENPGFMYINITSLAANQPTVYIRFRMQGLWDYWWQIDDLAFLEAPANDLMLEYIYPNFKYIDGGFYNQTPKSQVMDIYFGADVFNFGTNDQTNVTLNVQVDDFSSVVYDETIPALSSLASGVSEDSLGLLDFGGGILPAFLPPAVVKVYNSTFTVASDLTDENPANNVESISFATSDSVYARDNGIITGRVSTNTWVGGSVNGDAFGVAYDINNDVTVSSISIYIHENTNIGPSILAKLVFLDTVAGAWVEILTSGLYDIDDSSKLDTWVTLPFILTGSENLVAGDYIAAIECYYNDSLFWIAEDNITPQSFWGTRWKFDGNDWFAITNYPKTPFIRLNLNIGAIPLTATITQATDIGCYGGSDGFAVVTASGGTPPYTYLWDDALTQSTDTATGLVAGIYNITVTDDVANTATVSVTINEPDSLAASVSGVDNLCFGVNDGSADLTITGGTVPYSYQWSNGAGSQDIDSILAGTYFVTVIDANGCTVTDSVTITDLVEIIPSVTLDNNPTCYGVCDGSATASAVNGTLPYSYSWSDGQFIATASNLCDGTYIVTITDFVGCSAIDSIEIIEPPEIIITYTTTVVTNIGGSDGAIDITVTGGTIAVDYSYLWSPGGATTQDTSGLTYGWYDVTVTDDNSCTATQSIQVFQPPDPLCTLTSTVIGTDVSCYGYTDGHATASGNSGTPSYTYLWYDGQTDSTITNLAPGTYYVTVSDSDDPPCWLVDSAIINEPALITIAYTTTESFSGGIGGGTATANPSGGTPGYTYQWSNGDTGPTADSLNAEAYIVTVTDANGCTAISNTINVVEITCDLTASATVITDVICNGGFDGSAVASGSLGTPPYSYNWDNDLFQTTDTATGLSEGPYNVTVTDSMLCTATASVTITEPLAIVITVDSITEVDSAGATNGAIYITVSGGTSPYTFLWNDTSTDEDIDSISNETYTVIVTDDNSCSETYAGIVVPITSINEISNNDVINIYPNPTKGELYITNAENSTIYVYNIIGEVLYSIDNAATVNTIDISSFAEGAYIVKVVSDKYVITKKINLVK